MLGSASKTVSYEHARLAQKPVEPSREAEKMGSFEPFPAILATPWRIFGRFSRKSVSFAPISKSKPSKYL